MNIRKRHHLFAWFYDYFQSSLLILRVTCLFILASCKQNNKLFVPISSNHSGIHFTNTITENDSVNVIDIENVYNGGGVGIGDFNNDGLPDIYFTGNMVSNKLYINKGNLKFEDVTAIAGVDGEGKWSRGVSIVDINNDGLPDIYISETILKDSTQRKNILYINQGSNKDGIPVFKDMAKEYGLDDNSYTTQAAFFDYDNDGDLDVYLAVNVFGKNQNPNAYQTKTASGEHPSVGRLYRNDWDSAKGHPVFTNVSKEAGILQDGFSHSVTVCDINQDGWKDIFVTNDYLSEDVLYINNGNGTFNNLSKDYFKHTAYNAMGADVVDINNDGLSDVIELDMNPENNYRKKTMLNGGNYQAYLNNDYYGYQYQYIRNGLQLNMGNSLGSHDSVQHPVFGDIGFYSGVAETDWSWTPLVNDFDNDGFRDLIITNGFPKDITDHDFMAYRNTAFAMNDKQKLLSQIPEVKIPNYAYHNNGNLKFTDVTKRWGLDVPTFSNGAATADLDNDGDLDIVINNINDEALVYENKTNEDKEKPHHYLKIKLQGESPNIDAFGSWIKIFYDGGKQQVYETNPVRGYLSSNENIAFFGLGNIEHVDSVQVIWPNLKFQQLTNIKADQQLLIKQTAATELYSWQKKTVDNSSLFTEVSDSLNVKYTDKQKDFNDYNIQKLLPHKLSQFGPPMAVGDINNDGTDDLIIGSSDGNSETIFLQNENGKFQQKQLTTNKTNGSSFDRGLLLFDADGDKDLDLYVSVGGYEDKPGSATYQDKLYLNDGKANFRLDSIDLPFNHTSKSCVRAIDFDKDGDEDLFIGGRVEPWQYPKPVSCILLRNDSKEGKVKFTDVTATVAPSLQNIGLVCDATCADYNNDGWPDLVLAGEWMPLTFFKNENGKLVNETTNTGIADKHGWWNCITAADVDGDGKIDFVAGNAGENSFFSNDTVHPIKNYYNDFDKNGTYETIITKYIKAQDGSYHEYPVQSRDEVIDQLPFIKKKFPLYKDFAVATISDLFSKDDLNHSLQLNANYFSSSVIKNMGNGKFTTIALPATAQLSPVCDIDVKDIDGDGKLDLILCGNDYGAEVFNGRMDASNGLVLTGNGKGNFSPLSIEQSGIYLPHQTNSMVELKSTSGYMLLAACENNGPLKMFLLRNKTTGKGYKETSRSR